MNFEQCHTSGCILLKEHEGNHVIILENDEGRGVEFYSTPSKKIPFEQWKFIEPVEVEKLLSNSIIGKPEGWD
jgi:hypothetical protein